MDRNTRKTTSTDRLPPNSPEAEKGVLSCCFLSPNEVIPECVQKFKSAASEVFYDLRYQTIFNTLIEMWDDRDGIDLITVMNRLKVYNLLDQVGGLPELMDVKEYAPSSANWDYYAAIIFEKFLMRRMIKVCIETVSKIYDYEGQIDPLMDDCERDLLRVRELRLRQDTLTVQQLVVKALDEIEASTIKPGGTSGLASGFIDLDRLTGGFKPAEMIVIAGRPSMGKTSLAMNIAENVAVNEKVPVGVFSLEMTGTELIKRMLCSRAKVSLRNVRDGFMSQRDLPRIAGAASSISTAPIYLDDSASLSIMQLRAKARRMWQRYRIGLFVIDYLQLINALGGQRRHENRQQEVTEISGGVKSLAKELNVPIIILSQLNRLFDRERSRKPRLSDLRESGAIEQDADVVGMLYRPSKEDDDTPVYEESFAMNLLLAKQRNGPRDVDVELTFLQNITRFESAAKFQDVDAQGNFNV